MQVHFTARSEVGALQSGVLDVESLPEARHQIRQKGLFPVSLSSSETRAVTSAAQPTGGLPWTGSRVSRRDIMLITSQLAIMTKAGVDLADAIESLAGTSTNQRMKVVLKEVLEMLEEGFSFSNALATFPREFDAVYLAAIRAAEASGRLTEVLSRLADMLRAETRLRAQIRGAMAYPVILTVVSGVVLFAIMFFVLPQFSKVFADMGVELPLITSVLLVISDVLREHYLLVAAAVTGAGCAGWVAFRSRQCAALIDHLWLHSPVTRSAARSLLTGRTFQLLGAMLKAGIPLLESLRLSAGAVRSPQYRALVDRLEEEVIGGRGIGGTLFESKIIPPGAAQMVSTAEKAGQLAAIVELVGEHFEAEGEQQLRDRVRLLEPAVIAAMAVVVGTIVAAVMLPLMDLTADSQRGVIAVVGDGTFSPAILRRILVTT